MVTFYEYLRQALIESHQIEEVVLVQKLFHVCVAEGLIIGFVMWQSRKFHEVVEIGRAMWCETVRRPTLRASQLHTSLAKTLRSMLLCYLLIADFNEEEY